MHSLGYNPLKTVGITNQHRWSAEIPRGGVGVGAQGDMGGAVYKPVKDFCAKTKENKLSGTV